MRLGLLKRKLSSLLVLFFFCTPYLHAQAKDFAVVYNDFSGGFDDWTPAASMDKKRSPNTQNLVIDEALGKARKRNGYSNCGNIPSGNVPVAVFNFTPSPGDERLIISDSINFYETTDCVNFVTISTVQTAATMPDCEMVYGELWCVNGSDAPWRWDGSTKVDMDGTGTTPDIPDGSFIEFEKGRVWVGRIGSSRSSLFFSGLTNIAGDIITPSSSTAWPAANEIFINKDDGDVLHGLASYLGTIFPFKAKSIYKITGNDEFSFGVERVLSDFGTNSNHSIVEIDGLLNVLGITGLFQFDGTNANRILDNRSALFTDIFQPEISNDGKTWTTQEDWNAGTFSATTSTNIIGSVELSSHTILVDDFSDGDFSGNPVWTVGAGAWSISGGKLQVDPTSCIVCYIRTPLTQVYGTWKFTLGRGDVARDTGAQFLTNTAQGFSCLASQRSYEIRREATVAKFYRCINQSFVALCSFSTNSGDVDFRIERNGSNFKVFADDVQKCSFSDGNVVSSTFFILGGAETLVTKTYDNIDTSTYATSGIWESEAIDGESDLSSWGKVDFKFDKKGETLDFFKRLAATEGGLSSAEYISVLSGQRISTTTLRFVQFKATFSHIANNNAVSPELQDIVIGWQRGGKASLFPWAESWKNRYWLSYAVQGSSEKAKILIKSREPSKAVMSYIGVAVDAFTDIGETFYAVSASTDDVFILDSGFRDDANAIDAFWETPDDTMGLAFNHKYLHYIMIDYEKTGLGDFQVGYSTNIGSTFNDGTIFQTGTGRALGRVDTGSGPNTQYRFRFRNNVIDEQMEVHGLTVIGVSEPSFIP